MSFFPLVDDVSLGQGVLPRFLRSAGAVFSDYPGNGSFVEHFSRGALGKRARAVFKTVSQAIKAQGTALVQGGDTNR